MLKPIFSFLLLLTLLACTQAPQPYRHGRTGFDGSSLRLRDGGLVLILPMEGTPRPLGKILARSLADSLAVRNIPSTSNPVRKPNYTVRGQVITNFKNPEKNNIGSIYWTFSDQKKQIIHESSQLITASRQQWDFGDQAMVTQLVETAADEFANYLQEDTESKAVDASITDDMVIIAIKEIIGAPGDGQKALKKAMSLTLRQAGARVTRNPGKTGFLLSSEIDVLDPFEGKQRIKIAWIIKDVDGRELGRARQDNQVPAGSLDGRWGRMAYDVSKAAMNGIAEVVERHRVEQSWSRSRDSSNTTTAPGRRKLRMPPPF